MKLRTRLTIGAVIILVMALFGCCALVIFSSYSVLIADTMAGTEQEEIQLQKNIRISLKDAEDFNGSDRTKRAMLGYYFAQLDKMAADNSEYVLQLGDADLYNNSGVDAAKVLMSKSQENNRPYHRRAIVQFEGSYYCIAGGEMSLFNEGCWVSVVRDITEKINMVRLLVLRCALICVIITACGALLTTWFLKKALHPVEILKQQTQVIADGDYGCRVELKRKDELGELAENYNQMAQAIQIHVQNLENAYEEQNMLLHAMAHEMRTPVTAISGYAYALAHGKVNEMQQTEALDFIDSESQRLGRLSSKLTELVQLGDKTIERQDFLASDWQQSLIKILRDVQFNFDSGSFISGDWDLLTILVTNLCENAKKAGASEILISFQGGILSVTDNGCGILEKQLGKIMQPFYQGDASRSQEGFGLGLALCQRIAKLHGTELTVESIVGKGSRFSLNLYNYFTESERL